MVTKTLAGLSLVLGLAFAGFGVSANQEQAPQDCCAAQLACCLENLACCEAKVKPDCCEQGLACCDEAKECCAAVPQCCLEGHHCCEFEPVAEPA